MIINDKDAIIRLNSPHNLINQLRNATDKKNERSSAMSLFGIGRKKEETIEIKQEVKQDEVVISFNPFKTKESPAIPLPVIQEPTSTLETILEDHETQIKLGLAHDNALKLLNDSVGMLSTKLDNIKPEKLPAVIGAASKVVESIRKERSEASKNNKDREVHYHFYTPQQNKLTDYKVIDLGTQQVQE